MNPLLTLSAPVKEEKCSVYISPVMTFLTEHLVLSRQEGLAIQSSVLSPTVLTFPTQGLCGPLKVSCLLIPYPSCCHFGHF